MMPSIFVCHGGPNLILDNNDYTNFLNQLGKKFTPKAIVVFTAHWESDVTTISFIENNYKMIYDFGGFEEELYSFVYPAKGSIEIATKLQTLLERQGIATKKNTDRGLDHGSWVALYLMYPKANIPVVQVSVNPKLPLKEQYQIGQAIRELCKEDILVLGSGATVHNLATIEWNATETKKWALDFDDWLIDKVEQKDLDALFQFEKSAPNAKLAIPRNEHFVPLIITMGCGQNQSPKLLHRSYDYGTLSYICFEF
jgi:4,5-DOPA dioxygenase extradiol